MNPDLPGRHEALGRYRALDPDDDVVARQLTVSVDKPGKVDELSLDHDLGL